ncbi:glycosyltransferase [Cellulomonas sp. PhB150]|uniref:glycosyltransferase n=1 Tax=Cellulomonas sp. PhB150 TaxID=2485188 RepID=UPI000F4660E9|nr:glycosyltransferase [Cellulomonas sp. PhB150]ROS26068.1 putative glycosyltransferase [Cellulomonas sp. PhB150]
MTRPTVAWYVHHHGSGHATRLRAIAAHLDEPVVALGSMDRPPELPDHVAWVRLERDDEQEPGLAPPAELDPTVGGLLHWAPLGHQGHRRRLARLAEELTHHAAGALVVDTSVEVALLGRLLGVPTVVVTQPGRRDDAAHALGFAAATRIIAPWPERLLRPDHLAPVQESVVFTGGISRFEGCQPDPPRPGSVLVLAGGGGAAVGAGDLARAQEASPDRTWKLAGTLGDASGAWSADPWPDLSSAEVVVTWAGQNAIADVAAASARAVVVPQSRPFDEQHTTARALRDARLAVVQPAWPEPERWAEVLDEADRLTPSWEQWEVDGAARRAAAVVHAVATGAAR